MELDFRERFLMKLIATLTTALLFASACGDADSGTTELAGGSIAQQDQSAPFNSEPARAGGTDAARRAAFGSTPAPNPAEVCARSCGGSCGGICEALCFLCPNSDLARCLSAGQGAGNGNRDEGGELECATKAQLCLGNYGCPVEDLTPPQIEEEDF